MSYEDLGSELRPPLINQYMNIYQETAKIVRQAMTQLDEVQEEGEEQVQLEDLSKGARACTGRSAQRSGQRTFAKQAGPEMTRVQKWRRMIEKTK